LFSSALASACTTCNIRGICDIISIGQLGHSTALAAQMIQPSSKTAGTFNPGTAHYSTLPPRWGAGPMAFDAMA
jgi:hypothetical protein